MTSSEDKPNTPKTKLHERFKKIPKAEYYCINCADEFCDLEQQEHLKSSNVNTYTNIIMSHNIETCYQKGGHMQGRSKWTCFKTQIILDQQQRERNQTTKTNQTIAKENIALLMEIEDITRENNVIRNSIENPDSRRVMFTNPQEEGETSCLTHPP